jgi:hypothetical protein
MCRAIAILLNLQQLTIKGTAREFLKVLQSNTFKNSLGLGLSAKRYKKERWRKALPV